jgi:hypothetical protein
MGALLVRLRAWQLPEPLARSVEEGFEKLREEAARAARRRRLTPQDAAFLLLLVHDVPELAPLRRGGWLDILLRNQQPNGSWHAEPCFYTPTRNLSIIWWESRGATTAFAYEALQGVRRSVP